MYYTVEIQQVKDYFKSRGRTIENDTGEEMGDFMVVPDYQIGDIKDKSEIIINDWLTRSGLANTKTCGYQYTEEELETLVTEAICRLCYDIKYTCVIDEDETQAQKEYRQSKNTYMYLRDKGVL